MTAVVQHWETGVMDRMNTYALIMAGGGGTRFWPLSRQSMPKQLLNLSGDDIMINETINRCRDIIVAEDTFVVTNREQAEVMKDILTEAVPRENILAEPFGRNTAPCVLYAAMHILEKCGDGVICVFPSDHYITNTTAYVKIVREGIHAADMHETIAVIGVTPSYPATGYGYIKLDRDAPEGKAYRLERFVEKPGLEKAQSYLKDGGYFWNAGVFIARASVIVGLFERFLPKIYRTLKKVEGFFGTLEGEKLLVAAYESIESISFDYGIMERMDDALVVTGDFGWNDVGSWDALGAVFPADNDGNIVKAEHVGIDTKECIIYGDKKLIATVGIRGIVVVDTEDALLICPKDKAQEVKKVVEKLEKHGRKELL